MLGGSTSPSSSSSSSSSIIKINPTSKLKVMGTIDMKSRGEVVWSVDDPSIDLSSLSLSPLSSTLDASTSTPHVVSLVIPGPSSLMSFLDASQSSSSSLTFVLTLSCHLDNGHSSSSSLTIKTNSAPSLCSLVVSPEIGVMLETEFLDVIIGLCGRRHPLLLSIRICLFQNHLILLVLVVIGY